jgi:hypothetical protein
MIGMAFACWKTLGGQSDWWMLLVSVIANIAASPVVRALGLEKPMPREEKRNEPREEKRNRAPGCPAPGAGVSPGQRLKEMLREERARRDAGWPRPEA